MLPPRGTVRLIESPQTLHPRTLRIAAKIPKMLHLPPQRVLSRLKVQRSDLTLSQMPMLYGWNLMYRRPKRSFEARRLHVVPPPSSGRLVRHLKVYLVLLLPVAMRSLRGRCRMVGGNLELLCPCHYSINELSFIGVVLEYGASVE